MAGPANTDFLAQAAIYLGATAVAVPVFKRLKMGTILGYLTAGIILGPSVLGWLKVTEGVFSVAELGVVLFLFVIGLELSFPKLWRLKRTIFGLGLMQMLITGLIIGGGFIAFDVLSQGPAMVAGFALACSSTAFALSLLQERHELNTHYGTKSFSVLLFQDLAVIPLLAAVPLVAMQMDGGESGVPLSWLAVGKAAGVVVGIILIGRFALNPVLRLVAYSGSREAFAAAALFVVAATSLLVAQVGLSMALGAFLAGVLLAESSFRHQIESDIEPFRELLLGLFFIGVGMQLDLGVVADAWMIVLAGAVGLVLFKSVVLFLLARVFGADIPSALRVGAVLSQGGEFAFVVFTLGVGAGLFSTQFATIIAAIVTLSMMTTPLLMMAVTRFDLGRTVGKMSGVEDAPRGKVLIVGFGRIGQLVTHVLSGSGIAVTAIDSDPKRIEIAARFGNTVYFGDGTNINLLLQAGATEVDAVVFAIDRHEGLKPAVAALRERCPKVRILARVHDRIHELEMMDVETDFVVREMFESGLKMAQKTLAYLGFSDELVDDVTAEYRERDRERLLAQRAGDLFAHKDVLNEPFDALGAHREDSADRGEGA